MLSRVTIAEHCMVMPSDVSEAIIAFDREMQKLQKLTDPDAIAEQERVCLVKARQLAIIGNTEAVTATDDQFLEYVRDLRLKMETDPAWQEE
jgi:hypothetical protein